jgi:hypothetical protein
MEKIKKQVESALRALQLAENAVARLKIVKKPIEPDDHLKALLVEIKLSSDRIGS